MAGNVRWRTITAYGYGENNGLAKPAYRRLVAAEKLSSARKAAVAPGEAAAKSSASESAAGLCATRLASKMAYQAEGYQHGVSKRLAG